MADDKTNKLPIQITRDTPSPLSYTKVDNHTAVIHVRETDQKVTATVFSGSLIAEIDRINDTSTSRDK